MPPNDFWHIIGKARPASRDMAELNRNILNQELEPSLNEGLLHSDCFYQHYEAAVIPCRKQPIRPALALAYGGKHTYSFAAWLILQDRETYFAVLNHADNLVDTEAAANYCRGCLTKDTGKSFPSSEPWPPVPTDADYRYRYRYPPLIKQSLPPLTNKKAAN